MAFKIGDEVELKKDRTNKLKKGTRGKVTGLHGTGACYVNFPQFDNHRDILVYNNYLKKV